MHPPALAHESRSARRLQMREVLPTESGLLQEISDVDKRNIEQTFETIDDAAILAAADTFIQAETVHIIGLRKCFPIAFYFHYATRIFFPNSRLIQGQAGLYNEEISRFSKDDAWAITLTCWLELHCPKNICLKTKVFDVWKAEWGSFEPPTPPTHPPPHPAAAPGPLEP